MDTQLVFNAANVYTTLLLVVDEHRQTTSVFGSFFRTGQYQVKVCITIGDKSFYTIQAPAVFFFVEGSFQHDGL